MRSRHTRTPTAGVLAGLSGALALCAAAAAPGQTETADPEMAITGQTLPMESVRDARFRFLDRDGNGYLTRDEIGEDDPVLRSQFSSLDADDDERLSNAEYALVSRPQ